MFMSNNTSGLFQVKFVGKGKKWQRNESPKIDCIQLDLPVNVYLNEDGPLSRLWTPTVRFQILISTTVLLIDWWLIECWFILVLWLIFLSGSVAVCLYCLARTRQYTDWAVCCWLYPVKFTLEMFSTQVWVFGLFMLSQLCIVKANIGDDISKTNLLQCKHPLYW